MSAGPPGVPFCSPPVDEAEVAVFPSELPETVGLTSSRALPSWKDCEELAVMLEGFTEMTKYGSEKGRK